MPGSHHSSFLNDSEWVSHWVTDKHCQWSDSAPIKMKSADWYLMTFDETRANGNFFRTPSKARHFNIIGLNLMNKTTGWTTFVAILNWKSLPSRQNSPLYILNEDQMLDFTDSDSEKREFVVEMKIFGSILLFDRRTLQNINKDFNIWYFHSSTSTLT